MGVLRLWLMLLANQDLNFKLALYREVVGE